MLDGEKKSMSIVRRRRWTRKRICVSPVAKSQFIARFEWMQSKRESMLQFVQLFSRDSTQVSNYEDKRKPGVKESEDYIISSLKETAGMLDGVWTKLQLLKGFLIERGTLEMEYAHKMNHLGRKWIHAGRGASSSSDNNNNDNSNNNNTSSQDLEDGKSPKPPRKFSSLSENVAIISSSMLTTTASNSAMHDETSEATTYEESRDGSDGRANFPVRIQLNAEEALPKGFFYTINLASNSVADQLFAFAKVLTSSLPAGK